MRYVLLSFLMIASTFGFSQDRLIAVIATDTLHLPPVEYIYIASPSIDYTSDIDDDLDTKDELAQLYKGYQNILDYLKSSNLEYRETRFEELIQSEDIYNKQIEIVVPQVSHKEFVTTFSEVKNTSCFLSTTKYNETEEHYKMLLGRVLSKARRKAEIVAKEFNTDQLQLVEYTEIEQQSELEQLFSQIISIRAPGMGISFQDDSSVITLKALVKYSAR